jgi:hypothetical protein
MWLIGLAVWLLVLANTSGINLPSSTTKRNTLPPFRIVRPYAASSMRHRDQQDYG